MYSTDNSYFVQKRVEAALYTTICKKYNIDKRCDDSFEDALYTAINFDIEAALQIIKKRNSTFYQHDDEIEVDIDNVDAESFWELERFVTNYKKNLSKQKRKDELALQDRGTIRTAPVMNSAPMVAGALNSNTGKNNTSALATNAEAGRQMDNARRSLSSSSSSSDSGSSPSDSDCDSSSGSGSKVGH
ncbi:hypothetical protein KY289_001064 [Solanum tuberosum]|nr:hypothetical protein KY289_001064 [Solanum tuberosum]